MTNRTATSTYSRPQRVSAEFLAGQQARLAGAVAHDRVGVAAVGIAAATFGSMVATWAGFTLIGLY